MAVGETDGLSMREKALMKRRVNKQHNSNFKAGYVPINENYLHKTGLRGRKSLLLYGIVILLFLIVLCNLMVTLVLLSVLRIGYGMEGLEFLPTGRLLKFLVPSDLGNVIPGDGHIGGFANRDLNIESSNGQKIELEAAGNSQKPATISLGPLETKIKNVDSFRVINPNNGKLVFSSDYVGFGLPEAVRSLNVQRARLSRISSPIDESLKISSSKQIHLWGSEGIRMASKEVVWTTDEDLILKSVNGSIIVRGLNGTFIHTRYPRMPHPVKNGVEQFKICVCKESKRLFRIKITKNNSRYYSNCSHAVAVGNFNPCA